MKPPNILRAKKRRPRGYVLIVDRSPRTKRATAIRNDPWQVFQIYYTTEFKKMFLFYSDNIQKMNLRLTHPNPRRKNRWAARSADQLTNESRRVCFAIHREN